MSLERLRRTRRKLRRASWWLASGLGVLLPAAPLQAQVQVAGTLHVDLRASDSSAGSAVWTNQAPLGDFTEVGSPTLDMNVGGTGIPGVSFNGSSDAYVGPNSVPDIDGGSTRSIEVWAYNPSLAQEETTISWGHRCCDRRDMAFNFGNHGTWGAATHWGDDVSWDNNPPSANAWHHLAYTYSNQVARVYSDGVLINSKTLGGPLDTFPNEPLNLACQRTDTGGRTLWYSGFLNSVRVHGGVLSDSQILANASLGPAGAPTNPPPTPTGLSASPGVDLNYVEWETAAGAFQYHLKRGFADTGPFSIIASNLTTTSHLDTGLQTGTSYFYVVSAENAFGLSDDSDPVPAQPGVPAQPFAEGTLHVDLRATDSSAGASVWTNHAALGDFNVVGAPVLEENVALTGIPGVFFDGAADAYEGPNSVPDLDGGSDRSIETWAYNPSLVQEETMISWGHRGTTRRNMGFNFGSNPTWGAATHWADDVSWGGQLPEAQAWQHLVYTYESGIVHVYVNGELRNTKSLGGDLNTFPNEPINLACQRQANSTRSHLYGGYLNTVRVHGGALNPAQIQANFAFGPSAPPPVAQDDFVTLNPGAAALVPVLANDTAPPFFQPAPIIVTPPSSGAAEVKPNGRILYTHDGGISTSDQFTYYVQTLLGATSQVATVHVTISPDLRLPNTTMTVPAEPPAVGIQIVDAFPGLFFEDALAIATPPGRSNQIFVAERRGRISYIPDIHAVSPTRIVFLDIVNQVSFMDTVEGETGLLGLAFHPGFETNGYFYVYYTAPGGSPYFDRLSRFTADPVALTVNTNTQTILFDVVDQVFNHNGGDLHFGNDGYLYIGMGDEGDQFNFRLNSQRIDLDLYSALLRIDVDKRPGNLEPTPSANSTTVYTDGPLARYSIPADNPFVNATEYLGQPINTNTLRTEIFATGFRHIWRFSIDKPTGDIWVGDVGQIRFEEINIVTNGGNYGWAYTEGYSNAIALYPNEPRILSNPPPEFVHSPPLYVYPHNGGGGDPQLQGNSVTGGVLYRGNRVPELNGAYIFGDFVSANVWALWRTNGNVQVQRIGATIGAAGFGHDPSNGDVLIANYVLNRIERLVRVDDVSSDFPQTLSETGVFADVATLTPNPGVVNYDPLVAFWSDHAVKRRWFTIPDLTNQITFAADANWTFPEGMIWIKHFDLELERGNPASKKRIETRLLVRNPGGVFGVSYGWNHAGTEAFLVADGGTNFNLNVMVGGSNTLQQWEIPSRAACLACHTDVGGRALSFNTRELNQNGSMNGFGGNQIATLSQAGYFTAPVPSPQTLPAFAVATNEDVSLEYRVRSYLAVNCVQCHQPGGTGASSWDARPWVTLEQTGLINGTPEDDGANPLNKLIVPGDTNHSVVLLRLKGEGFSRMPPLATHQLDEASIDLLARWIVEDLPGRLSYEQFIAQYPSLMGPDALRGADPDGDGSTNEEEWLTGKDPTNGADYWKLLLTTSGDMVHVQYPLAPNLGVVVDTTFDFNLWSPWDVPGNEPFYGSASSLVNLSGLLSTNPPYQYFRARFIEP